jgi:S1-C subfamily serine protease
MISRPGLIRLLTLVTAVTVSASVCAQTLPAEATAPQTAEGSGNERGTPVETKAPQATPASPGGAWQKALYQKLKGSVVRVETDRGVGTGFLFHSQSHIATAFHVIEDADQIQVVLVDGTVIQAQVAAHDKKLDVALLHLELPIADALVLEPATDLEIGDRVAAIGHPLSLYTHMDHRLSGLLDWTLTSGIIGALSSSYVQTDAAVNPGNSGGPLLSEDGKVVGIVSFQIRESQGVNVAVRSQMLLPLVQRLGRQGPPPRNIWQRNAFEFGYAAQYGERTLQGLSLGFDLTAMRRYSFAGRGMLFTASARPGEDDVINHVIDRTSFELEAGYRLGLPSTGTHDGLAVGVGAALHFERNDVWTLVVSPDDPACVTNCTFDTETSFERDKKVRFLPMVTGSLTLSPLRVGYAYQIDFNDADASIHRLFVGLAL